MFENKWNIFYSPDDDPSNEGGNDDPSNEGGNTDPLDPNQTLGDGDNESTTRGAIRGRILWDRSGQRIYETGVNHGVLYPKTLTGTNVTELNGGYDYGVPWNGLISVNENPSGGEANPLYADNIKYLNLVGKEEFGGTIEAYTYPEEFAECDGSKNIQGVYFGQQRRKEFGFCYRTEIGNDEEGNDYGYKIHIVYGALASPSGKQYSTINETPEAIQFSWEFTTTPIDCSDMGADFAPVAQLTIDSNKVSPSFLAWLEETLYGKDATATAPGGLDNGAYPRLPRPQEIYEQLVG